MSQGRAECLDPSRANPFADVEIEEARMKEREDGDASRANRFADAEMLYEARMEEVMRCRTGHVVRAHEPICDSAMVHCPT